MAGYPEADHVVIVIVLSVWIVTMPLSIWAERRFFDYAERYHPEVVRQLNLQRRSQVHEAGTFLSNLAFLVQLRYRHIGEPRLRRLARSFTLWSLVGLVFTVFVMGALAIGPFVGTWPFGRGTG